MIALRKGLRRYFSTACSREPHRPVTFSRFNTVCLLLWLHLQHCLLQSCLRDTQPDRTNWPEAPTDFLRPSAGTICHCWVNSRESSSRLHDLEVLLASSTRNDCRLLCSHSKDTRGELYKQRKRDHMGHFSCFSPLTANYMTFLLQRQRTFSLLFFFFWLFRIPSCSLAGFSLHFGWQKKQSDFKRWNPATYCVCWKKPKVPLVEESRKRFLLTVNNGELHGMCIQSDQRFMVQVMFYWLEFSWLHKRI